MLKNQIRKKILNIRNKKKSDKFNIDEKILKIIKIKNKKTDSGLLLSCKFWGRYKK